MVGLQIFLLSHQFGRERGASFMVGSWVILLSQCGRERRGRISFEWVRKFCGPKKCQTLRCLGLNLRWVRRESERLMSFFGDRRRKCQLGGG
ncbi:hypothetical protein AMTRI_Chr10g231310 [Amborella trichopoda]